MQEVGELLLRVRDRIDEHGWWPVPGHPTRLTLFEALRFPDDPADDAVRWMARLLLQRLSDTHCLADWDAKPLRCKRDVTRLLNAAIRKTGATVGRKGGWYVTARPGCSR
jgi:hypothetical protein